MIAPAADGFHHPASEHELATLVKTAFSEGRELRVRGAVHSLSHVVYSDPIGELPNHVGWQQAPPGDNVNVMLDRYRGWRVKDEGASSSRPMRAFISATTRPIRPAQRRSRRAFYGSSGRSGAGPYRTSEASLIRP